MRMLHIHRIPRQIEAEQDSRELQIDAFASCCRANQHTRAILLAEAALGRHLGSVVTTAQHHDALTGERLLDLAGDHIDCAEVGGEDHNLVTRILSPQSSLVAHEAVSEAAVVGYPHDIKGQGIYAYVTLMKGTEPTEALRKELVAWVRKDIGPIASPDLIQFAPGLPKTRSGKIMRRILRKIAEDEPSSLGDTSTPADPAAVDDLVQNRQNKRGAQA